MLIYLLSTFICTDWNLFVSCFLIQLHKVFAEFKPKHSTILATSRAETALIYLLWTFRTFACTPLIYCLPKCETANTTKPLLSSPWSGHKALRGPPWVTKPTFNPFNQPTKHAKQSRPARKGRGGARAKKAGSNCLHAEKLNQKYFSQLKCLLQNCRKSSQRGRGLTEGGRQRKGHLGITKYVCKRDFSLLQHLNCKKSLLKKSVAEKYRMRDKIQGKKSVVGEREKSWEIQESTTSLMAKESWVEG